MRCSLLIISILPIMCSCQFGGSGSNTVERETGKPEGVTYDSLVDYSGLDTLLFIPDNSYYESQEIFEVQKFIKLETNAECLIGSIGKVKYVDGLFYLLDDYTGRSAIHVFDTLGNHIRSLRRIGRGPGEYKEILDFDLDENRNLYIINSTGNILVYDSLFQYSKTINQEIAIRMISVYNGFIIGITFGSTYRNPQGKLLHILSPDGKSLMSFLEYNQGVSNSNNRGSALTKSNGRVYVNIPYSPIIFSIDSAMKVKAEFYLDLNYKMPDGRSGNRFVVYPFKSFFYSEQLIICGTSLPTRFFDILATGFYYNGNSFLPTVIRDRISLGVPNPLPLLGMTGDGTGISVQDAHHLKYCQEHDGMEVITDSAGVRRRVYSSSYLGSDTLPGSIYDQIRNLDENDNPCIIMVRIKPFSKLN